MQPITCGNPNRDSNSDDAFSTSSFTTSFFMAWAFLEPYFAMGVRRGEAKMPTSLLFLAWVFVESYFAMERQKSPLLFSGTIRAMTLKLCTEVAQAKYFKKCSNMTLNFILYLEVEIPRVGYLV